VQDAFAARVGQELGAIAEQPAARRHEVHAHAVAAAARAPPCGPRRCASFSITAPAALSAPRSPRPRRLAALTVDLARDDLGARHGELVALAAHRLDQDPELELAAAGDEERLGPIDSTTEIATLPSARGGSRSSIWRLVTKRPSRPASGDVLAEKCTRTVGGSTWMRGSGSGTHQRIDDPPGEGVDADQHDFAVDRLDAGARDGAARFADAGDLGDAQGADGDPGRLDLRRHDAAHRLRQLRVAVAHHVVRHRGDPVARGASQEAGEPGGSRSPGRGRGAGRGRAPARWCSRAPPRPRSSSLAAVGGALAGQVEAQLARPAGIGRDAEQPARQEAPAGRNNPRRHSQQRRVDDGDAVRRAGPADRDAQPDREQGDDQDRDGARALAQEVSPMETGGV